EEPAESSPADEEIPDSSPANLPAEITGAFLTCKVQPAEDPERELLGCQLRQKDKDAPVPLGGLIITWSFSTPDGKALVPENLPIKSSSSLHGLFEFASEDLAGGV